MLTKSLSGTLDVDLWGGFCRPYGAGVLPLVVFPGLRPPPLAMDVPLHPTDEDLSEGTPALGYFLTAPPGPWAH